MRNAPIAAFLATLALAAAATGAPAPAQAGEGMWVPQQLPEIAGPLREAGLRLAPEQLADLTGDPMGAVVSLGGCTASFVSPGGLVATNHHCAYGDVHALSTPEHNYLEEGFWAMRADEEVNIKDKSVYFLKRVIDVTDEVHALHKAVADTENKLLLRAIRELKPDGYMISDDLGTQNSLMMSPDTFREFIKPYYRETWGIARENDVDVWLHTCGNIMEIIGDLIECGLSVLHPIQKHTMDWDAVAAQWKGKIAFWVGMDVQDTLINGTPEEVRREVRLMRDTFDSPEGGFLYASGNGIVRGTPIDNIEAYLNECITYKNDGIS